MTIRPDLVSATDSFRRWHAEHQEALNRAGALESAVQKEDRSGLEEACRWVLDTLAAHDADETRELFPLLEALGAEALRDELEAGHQELKELAERLLAATGVDALHFSARGMRPSGMEYRNPQISMGGCPGVPEYASPCADEQTIRQIPTELDR